MLRDHCDEENVRLRMRLQWSDEIKAEKSDYVIHNDGSTMLLPQIIEVHQAIIASIDNYKSC